MSHDMQAVVDLARQPLEDDDKDRYTDPDLLSYARTGLLMIRTRRPDLFFGQYDSEPNISALTLTDLFPLADEYVQPTADYITGRVSTYDADHVVSERYKAFMELFGATI